MTATRARRRIETIPALTTTHGETTRKDADFLEDSRYSRQRAQQYASHGGGAGPSRFSCPASRHYRRSNPTDEERWRFRRSGDCRSAAQRERLSNGGRGCDSWVLAGNSAPVDFGPVAGQMARERLPAVRAAAVRPRGLVSKASLPGIIHVEGEFADLY